MCNIILYMLLFFIQCLISSIKDALSSYTTQLTCPIRYPDLLHHSANMLHQMPWSPTPLTSMPHQMPWCPTPLSHHAPPDALISYTTQPTCPMRCSDLLHHTTNMPHQMPQSPTLLSLLHVAASSHLYGWSWKTWDNACTSYATPLGYVIEALDLLCHNLDF